MDLVNRAVGLVRIKKPFLDWINSTGKPGKLTLESVNRENHAYLLPEHDTPGELEEILDEVYEEIFELELAGFCTDRSNWPEISYTKFREWCNVEVHSMVFDPFDDEIEKEEYWEG